MKLLKEQFSAQFAKCASTDECLELMIECTNQLGFEYVAYGIRMPFNVSQPKTILINNYTPEWQETYASNNFLNVDPTVKHAMTSVLPVEYNNNLFADSTQFYEAASAEGIRYGWAQPVHDIRSCGLVSFSRDSENTSATELLDKSHDMTWLSQTVHTVISQLVIQSEYPESQIKLTARETEVLRWTAEGKTSNEIGMILNIAERTVNFHIRNTMMKLDCNNKTSASIKAALFGLLK